MMRPAISPLYAPYSRSIAVLVEQVLVPPGLLHSLSPLPYEAKLLKMTLVVTLVTHKGLGPRLRLRLGLWSLWWRLRLGGLGVSFGLGLGCPLKGV